MTTPLLKAIWCEFFSGPLFHDHPGDDTHIAVRRCNCDEPNALEPKR